MDYTKSHPPPPPEPRRVDTNPSATCEFVAASLVAFVAFVAALALAASAAG